MKLPVCGTLPGARVDRIDKAILDILQHDATAPLAEIARKVNLSQTPCWRRIQRMEQAGYIRKRVALLESSKLNLGVTVFVMIKTNQHTRQWYEAFSRTVQSIPEVMDFYRMSGTLDYLLRIVVPDIAAYDMIYRRLTADVEIFDVSASFAMEQIMSKTELPLDYAAST